MVTRRRFPFWRIVAGLVVGLTVGIGMVVVGASKLSDQRAICLRVDFQHVDGQAGPLDRYYSLMFDMGANISTTFLPVQIDDPRQFIFSNGQYSVHTQRRMLRGTQLYTPWEVAFRSSKDGSTVVQRSDDLRHLQRYDVVVWSPNNERVAYWAQLSGKSGNGGYDTQHVLVVAKADGSEYRFIPQKNSRINGFQWSADSMYLATGIEPDTLKFIPIDNPERPEYSVQPYSQFFGTWSPKGHQYAYILNSTLHIVSPDNLTDNAMIKLPRSSYPLEYSMDWSPDGRYVLIGAYVSLPQIYSLVIYSADGKQVANPGYAYRGKGNPIWSPDGQQLLYVQSPTSAFVAYHLSDGHIETIASNVAGEAILMPDKQHIVFVQRHQHGASIFMLQVTTQHMTPVIANVDEVKVFYLSGIRTKVPFALTREGTVYNVDVISPITLKPVRLRSGLRNTPHIPTNSDQALSIFWREPDGTAGIDSYEFATGRVAPVVFNITDIGRGELVKFISSPDLQTILRISEDAMGGQNTHIIYADGRPPLAVHRNIYDLHSYSIRWSADNLKAAYILAPSRMGGRSLEVLNVDGRRELQWSNLPDGYLYHEWVPCAPIT
jgi:hypothetical protein